MDPDQTRDLETDFNGILNQSVREGECQSRHTQDPGGLGGLDLTRSSARVPSRFTVTQVDDECRQSIVRELRNCPAHRDFYVVGMGTEREHVESLSHSHSA
jgi:hypothetical protein